MLSNQFFDKQGPFTLKKILTDIRFKGNLSKFNSLKISDIKNLSEAKKNDITFLNSSKYKKLSLKTKAIACVTSSNFSNLLPESCIKIFVKNVLLSVTQISRIFYPFADVDYPDKNLNDFKKIKKNIQKYILEKMF